jgi:hypothetical protein
MLFSASRKGFAAAIEFKLQRAQNGPKRLTPETPAKTTKTIEQLGG